MADFPRTAEDVPGIWSHRTAVVNGVRLHYVEAGRGPLVLLLHGFPEFWYCWRKQIPALARAGFHVVAPDQRGYNLSDKPRGVRHYRMRCLIDDAAELIRHAGRERAVVVGHDWGGVVAWGLAAARPDLVERLVVLNAPHPALYQREMRRLPQLLKSWYACVFQLPVIPEIVCRLGRFGMLSRSLRDDPGGLRPRLDEQELSFYRRALARPGALTSAINYYRAAVRDMFVGRAGRLDVRVPTHVLWGERDRYLGVRLLDGLRDLVANVEVTRFPDASHWLQIDEAEAVTRAIIRAGSSSSA